MSNFGDWETELYHHGILGMKWGVRRYQNKDGTWTSAGLRRKAKLERLDMKLNAKNANYRAKLEKHRSIKSLSDDELRKRIDRLNLEKRYKDLKNEDLNGVASIVSKILERSAQKESNKLKKQEYEVRLKEAKSRMQQAKQNAKQAKSNAEQAKANAKRDSKNKHVNELREKNKKTELSLIRKALKQNPSKYKDYLNGKITIDEILDRKKDSKDSKDK